MRRWRMAPQPAENICARPTLAFGSCATPAGTKRATPRSAIVTSSPAAVLDRCDCATQAEALGELLGRWSAGRVILESTPLAEWAATVVEANGHEAVIIDARAARHLVHSKKKTDARDAYTLARLAHSGWYVEGLRRRKGAAKAKVAVARKLVMLLWLSGERFDAQRGLAGATA